MHEAAPAPPGTQHSSTGFRTAISIICFAIGFYLLLLAPFYFTPWHQGSWIHAGLILLWVVTALAVDPLRFDWAKAASPAGSSRAWQRTAFVALAVLILLPFILWVLNWSWFFPWLPWQRLAYRWMTRDFVTVLLIVLLVPTVAPRFSLGRRLCLLLGLVFLNHLSLMLAHAGMSGGPEYLQDGITQDDFLSQYRFKLITALLLFLGGGKLVAALKPRLASFRARIVATGVPLLAVTAVLLYGWSQKLKEGPHIHGKSVARWIAEAPTLDDETDPAVATLRELGRPALPYLMKALTEGKAEFHWFGIYSAPPVHDIRQQAAVVLKGFRHEAAPIVPDLLPLLKGQDERLGQAAIEIIGNAGVSNDQTRRALLEALAHPELDYFASHALAQLGWRDTNIVYELATIAESRAAPRHYWATVALSYLGPRARPALPVLVKIAGEPGEARAHAVHALALIGPDAIPAVPALVSSLATNEDWEARSMIIALGRIGPPASNAVPVLQRRLTNADISLKFELATALWRIDPTERPRLLPILESTIVEGIRANRDNPVLAGALATLAELGEQGRPFLNLVLPGLESSGLRTRFSTAWAVCHISPEHREIALKTFSELAAIDFKPPRRDDPRTPYEILVEAREREDKYPAAIAAAGALWTVDPARRAEHQATVAGLLKHWSHFHDLNDAFTEQQVLVPVLNAILADSNFNAFHPVAVSVLCEISGPRSERGW